MEIDPTSPTYPFAFIVRTVRHSADDIDKPAEVFTYGSADEAQTMIRSEVEKREPHLNGWEIDRLMENEDQEGGFSTANYLYNPMLLRDVEEFLAGDNNGVEWLTSVR